MLPIHLRNDYFLIFNPVLAFRRNDLFDDDHDLTMH